MAAFEREFKITDDTRILDVGGHPFNWRLIKSKPRVVIANLTVSADMRATPSSNIQFVIADGRRLPFTTNEFDIVYSSSTIEHLGTASAQKAFAGEVARAGRRYYVQTPNRNFPVEPHLLGPFIRNLPRPVQKTLIRYCTLWGILTGPSAEQIERFLSEVRLLDVGALGSLFPGVPIKKERVLGLVKSLIAVRQ